MNKRLTRSDYLFALLFIFMLFCTLGAFFYGLKLGAERTEARYEQQRKAEETASKGLTAYHQSYLVSFYHTIYLPYKDFQNKWFQDLASIESGGSSVDPSSLLKELAKLAEEKAKSVEAGSAPETSPLLQSAHQKYKQSLALFHDGADSLRSKSGSARGSALLSQIQADHTIAEAQKLALQAQKDYFDAIVKWNEKDSGPPAGMELLKQDAISIADWDRMNLNLKNDYMASRMAAGRLFEDYMPQDLASRVDEMIKTGQAKKMNAADIPRIIEALTATNAVRAGDFLKNKPKWYMKEPLPQLPFFTASN